MPTGLLALIAISFGFDAPLWRLMGYGLDWMIAVALWVASLPDGDARLPTDPALKGSIACDPTGCVGRLADGRLGALSPDPSAFAEDCARTTLLLTPCEAPPDCAATVIDRWMSRAGGALALTRAGEGDRWQIEAARPSGQDRPWARTVPAPAETSPNARAAPRDATPRAEDLETGD